MPSKLKSPAKRKSPARRKSPVRRKSAARRKSPTRRKSPAGRKKLINMVGGSVDLTTYLVYGYLIDEATREELEEEGIIGDGADSPVHTDDTHYDGENTLVVCSNSPKYEVTKRLGRSSDNKVEVDLAKFTETDTLTKCINEFPVEITKCKAPRLWLFMYEW